MCDTLSNKQRGEEVNMKTKQVKGISAEMIADYLNNVATELYTKVSYDLLEGGTHRKTWCACVYELSRALDDQAMEDDCEFDKLAFLDRAGFFEVAGEKVLSDWAYCTERSDYIDEE